MVVISFDGAASDGEASGRCVDCFSFPVVS